MYENGNQIVLKIYVLFIYIDIYVYFDLKSSHMLNCNKVIAAEMFKHEIESTSRFSIKVRASIKTC